MNGIKTLLRSSAVAALAVMLSTTNATASSIFADWSNNSLNGIGFTLENTITSGRVSVTNRTATDADFVNNFGSAFAARWVGVNTDGDPADILQELTFDQALPTGSILLLIDVDFDGEAFDISSDQGILSLLDQGETIAGESSNLPSYDRTTGRLSEDFPGTTGGSLGNNKEEFSAFDLSGVTKLSLNYLFSSSKGGARYTFATPVAAAASPGVVPLPASLPLALVGLAGLGAVARRKRS
jgi:hypothetical protein